jgi:hypothetical protein
MESLADGISSLSISESPLTSTTPAMARIPQSHDLDDNSHQALDKTILKRFDLYIELNREPDWAFLLLAIVRGDGRLSWLSEERANELLKRESSFMTVLQKGGLTAHLRRFVDWVRRPIIFRPIIVVDVATNLSDLLWNHERSAPSAGYESTPHEGKVPVNCVVVLRIADGFMHEQPQV